MKILWTDSLCLLCIWCLEVLYLFLLTHVLALILDPLALTSYRNCHVHGRQCSLGAHKSQQYTGANIAKMFFK